MSQTTVYDIAWDFRAELEDQRNSDPLRPLVFVAHSLGGIVVKELLRQASLSLLLEQDQPFPPCVFTTTRGIVFFGTPHGGADPRGFLQKVAEILVKSAGFKANEQVVNSLLPSAERLKQLRYEFHPIAHRQNWMIHSFRKAMAFRFSTERRYYYST